MSIEPLVLDTKIDEIVFSVRTTNILLHHNITTVRQLTELTARQLLNFRNFGRKSLNEIRSTLQNLGLSLKDDFFLTKDTCKSLYTEIAEVRKKTFQIASLLKQLSESLPL